MNVNEDNVLSVQLSKVDKLDLLITATVTLSLVFLVYVGVILGLDQFIHLPLKFLRGNTLHRFFTLWQLPYNQLVTIITLAIGGSITYHRVKRHAYLMKLNKALGHLNYIAETNQFQYRIEQDDSGDLWEITESINRLVDSTERSIAEERRAEETKNELIANVSHDIRTPLTSIIGYLDAITRQRYESEAERDWFVQVAYDKAKLMRNLVNDLFLYVESSQTSYALQMQEVSIQLFFEQLAVEFQWEAREQNVDMVIEVAPAELKAVMDVEKMARAFTNLITNALKYGRGSRIRLRAYTEIGYNGVNRLVMETRNNGELLQADEYQTIFERSYRSEKSRTSEIPGSGLGLSIVKNIVNLHKGHVYAFVEEDETVFRVVLTEVRRRG